MLDPITVSDPSTLRRRERALERKSGLPASLWWAGLLIVTIIIGYPLLRLLLTMFQAGGRFSLESLGAAFTRSRYLATFANTLAVGLAATVLALAAGVPLALIAGRVRFPAGRTLRLILVLPYLIPGFVFAFAWRELLGPVGYVNRVYMAATGQTEPLFSIYGPAGVIMILALRGYPIAYITVLRALQNMNVSYEQAAEVFGAGRARALRTITLPLMRPAVAGAALLVFSSTVANFGVPAILGIPKGFYVLTTEIYSRILAYGMENNLNVAASLSLYLIAAGLLFLWLQSAVITRRSYVVVTGKGGPQDRAAAPRGAWVYTCVLSLMGLSLVLLPLAAVVLSSLIRAYGLTPAPENLTLAHFAALMTDTLTTTALRNSFALALLTASLCVVIGLLIALVTEKSRIRGRRLLDFVATAPRSVPGTIIALSFILAWIRPIPLLGISLYNTFWIILLAYVARFLGYTVRTISTSLKQISPSLEEACLIAGGRNRERVVHVLAPLSAEGLAGGWLLVFIPALNELTMSILLYSSGNETIGVAVFSLLQEGLIGRASAFSLVIIAIVLLGDRLLFRVTKGRRHLLG